MTCFTLARLGGTHERKKDKQVASRGQPVVTVVLIHCCCCLDVRVVRIIVPEWHEVVAHWVASGDR
jgi:hypothetical protein